MLRRQLLKAVPALAAVTLHPKLTWDGQTQSAVAAIPPGHYIFLADPGAVDFEGLMQMECPEGVTMDCLPVRLYGGRSIRDVVAIYKIDPGESLPNPSDDGAKLVEVISNDTDKARTILGLKK